LKPRGPGADVASIVRRSYPYSVTVDSLGYEIREAADPYGGMLLELVVEGVAVARARASETALGELNAILGLTREDVAQHLRRALHGTLRSQGQSVEVADVVEDSHQPLRFFGRFTYRTRGDVSTGLVWYDVSTSNTGPEDLPAIVRNKMRFEVHRQLTEDGSAARALVDLHK
jgi:hypothetical protein